MITSVLQSCKFIILTQILEHFYKEASYNSVAWFVTYTIGHEVGSPESRTLYNLEYIHSAIGFDPLQCNINTNKGSRPATSVAINTTQQNVFVINYLKM